MNIKEAIGVLKEAKYIGSDIYATDYDKRMNEAIDTVVAELEKDMMIMMFPMTEKEKKYKEMEREALERVNGIVFKDGCFNTNLPDSFNYALGYVDSKYISRSYIPDDIQIPKCKR